MREPSLDDLTPYQLKVLFWMAEGKPIWETAHILTCATGTVKKHRGRIYENPGSRERALGDQVLPGGHGESGPEGGGAAPVALPRLSRADGFAGLVR